VPILIFASASRWFELFRFAFTLTVAMLPGLHLHAISSMPMKMAILM